MLLIDEKKLSQTTIEAIGHNYGISDAGLMFDEYAKKVCQVLQVRKKKGIDSKVIGQLKLCGLKVYLYSLTGKEMNARSYAEWLGKECTSTIRQDFSKGLEDMKAKIEDCQ